ncbi:pseudouridine synthase [Porphyromonas crevioricanis]|uniref:tRNA pseudouridine synthase A n=2 Tax=Porphyromonas crevioricanis TaxID=393921 RepID=A0A0A2FCJ5_9PORP|nr:tRNA pseudouridine(38-40) synthase TruA [Porphyromonas crevioricanis]KGN88761.1 pseudouridine synthase [Porphyromonas crevioricanis]KGN96453.1 pseudouridine synthase [Porphyromonas crevioricanis]SJZ94608.1 tRNA pseudouridine38-40 synthase [Porphyromonas crevioricanis]SQH73623.1 tRNA pseudouridine synthase A [Porphyromonas crevioricanis]GAD05468.1 tRNA pseudouridine synthase A [Porphyromonas crevioricanis JCM 15906]
MRFFIYFSYNGEQYSGWQNQPNAPTVQQQVESCLSVLLRKQTIVVGAGRTDAGVHARCMVAHFDANIGIADAADLVPRLNGLLPKDISIDRIVPVSDEAHARFSATARTYKYFVCDHKDSFVGHLMLRVHAELDYELMNKAASVLLEYSDFECFSKAHTDVKTFNCKIREAYWSEGPLPGTHVFTITADRFLRNMVRAVVGTLFTIGRGKASIEDLRHIILSKDRSQAGSSAPGNALFLWHVEYPYSLFL